MLISLNGVPGKGKTLTAVALAKKHYKKENSIIIRLLKKRIIRNTVYSNVPILLDKKRKEYSNICSVYDLDNSFRFPEGSLIIIDEEQAYHDSNRDFKDFPRAISSFLQFHRHFGIKDIIIISQSPRRLVTYIRDICEYYHRIKTFIKIPLVHLGVIVYKRVPEFDNYYMAFTNDKEEKKKFDISTHFYFFNYKKCFQSYKTKYLISLNSEKPIISYGKYSSTDMPEHELEFLSRILFDRGTSKKAPLLDASEDRKKKSTDKQSDTP